MKARSVTGRDRRKLGDRPNLKKTGTAVCPRIKAQSCKKRHPMRGRILLSEHQLVATKGCKNATGGFAPQTPRKLADFLFMKIGGYGIS